MKLSLVDLGWTLPLLAAGVWALVRGIKGVARVAQQNELASAPVAPGKVEAALRFDAAGAVLVYFEEPELLRLRSLFRELQIYLVHTASGWTAPLHSTGLGINLMRSKQSRFSKGTALYYRKTLRLPAAGEYRLRVSGFGPAEDYTDCAVVFMRPAYLGQSALWVLLIVFGGVAAIGGFIFALIAVAQNS